MNCYFNLRIARHIKASMIFLGFNVIDMVVVSGIRNMDDYKNHLDVLNHITNFNDKDWNL